MIKINENFKHLISKENLIMEHSDGTRLKFRILHSKTPAAKDEISSPRYKKSNARLTISSCSNASGSSKLKTVLVGKSRKPKALKDVSISSF